MKDREGQVSLSEAPSTTLDWKAFCVTYFLDDDAGTILKYSSHTGPTGGLGLSRLPTR